MIPQAIILSSLLSLLSLGTTLMNHDKLGSCSRSFRVFGALIFGYEGAKGIINKFLVFGSMPFFFFW